MDERPRVTPPASSPRPWHALPTHEVAEALGVDPRRGLADAEAKRRLAEVGENCLPEDPPPSFVRLIARQLKSVLILVLLAAGAVAIAAGEGREATGILLVVGLNALVGALQERRAARSLASLRSMLAPTARARRGGEEREVPAASLVPGDVVIVEAGDRFPADGRLLEVIDLEVDESTLTGESLAVTKTVEPVAEEAGIGDRTSVVYSHTLATRGRARLVITATGPRTEAGQLAKAVSETKEPPTPLERELDRLGKLLAVIVGSLCAFLLAWMLARGVALPQALMVAVALAAAAIPEGLPAVVTLTLALGVRRMAKARAIVRRLTSVESLGSVTVICTDKTGTLTENRMAPGAFVTASGEVMEPAAVAGGEGRAALGPLLDVITLCNDASGGSSDDATGDPTERALLDAAGLAGLDVAARRQAWPRLGELPFSSDLLLMATWHASHAEGHRLLVKGAAHVLLPRCAHRLAEDGASEALGDDERERLLALEEELSHRGLRVLCCARGASPDGEHHGEGGSARLEAALHDLELVGMVGLVDPPRAEAREAIADAKRAGIRVLIITGDHAGTAAHVAAAVGIEGEAVAARELRDLDDEALAARLEKLAVVARVAPEDKARVVRALQAQGHVVCMTGDGVNDAVALSRSDVGVAMGLSGADTAREAADLVLTDDDLGTIVRAVLEGRAIYSNILRFLLFQLSTAAGAIVVVFAAPLVGAGAAELSATQLLFVNLVMDGPPALALGAAPPRGDELDQPPRPRGQRMLTLRRLLSVGLVGGLMGAATLFVMVASLGDGADAARTTGFTAFVVLQCANALVWRGRSGLFEALRRSPWLPLALALVLVAQVLVVYVPAAGRILATVPLGTHAWVISFGLAGGLLVLDGARRVVARLR